jgi:hypothetical protein
MVRAHWMTVDEGRGFLRHVRLRTPALGSSGREFDRQRQLFLLNSKLKAQSYAIANNVGLD